MRRSTAPGGYGTITKDGYRAIRINGKQVPEHRHLWEQHFGPIPKGKEVYHKNGDKLDNKIENLELKENKGYIGHGYRLININGRRGVREHRHVWEQHFGPIPEGMEIHHKNKDKLDNRIENLELIDHSTHLTKYHHSNFVKDGVEHKRCPQCKQEKPTDQFHKRTSGNRESWCKSCLNERHLRDYYKRKARRSQDAE